MPWYELVFAALIGYLIGSIPVGYIVIYIMKGQDIRRHGSGRTGGTNALRAGGSWAGLATGIGDIVKGFLAVIIAHALLGPNIWIEVVAGITAVCGHNWSIYMG